MSATTAGFTRRLMREGHDPVSNPGVLEVQPISENASSGLLARLFFADKLTIGF